METMLSLLCQVAPRALQVAMVGGQHVVVLIDSCSGSGQLALKPSPTCPAGGYGDCGGGPSMALLIWREGGLQWPCNVQCSGDTDIGRPWQVRMRCMGCVQDDSGDGDCGGDGGAGGDDCMAQTTCVMCGVSCNLHHVWLSCTFSTVCV